jgi:transitional endoplasmic reticulum ATPase
LEDVKGAFREAIEIPLLHPELMEQYHVRPSRGILMFGPPGCGKTLVVKAAADEMDIVFLTVSGAQLMKQGYGHAVNVIKETFNRARENPPAVVFVDEIETIAPSREMGRTDIVGQFLTEMDGLKELKGVVVVGATNKPSMLDPAILRPGRFDKIFYIHPPDAKGRGQLFSIHFGEFAKGLDLAKLARLSEGFSGADIAALAQEAKMQMVRDRIAGREPRITTDEVLRMLSMRRPSITAQALMEYEDFLREYGERH